MTSCEECGYTESLVKHHESYDQTEEEEILCRSCHQKRHRTGTKFVSYKPGESYSSGTEGWRVWEVPIYRYKIDKGNRKDGSPKFDFPSMIRVPKDIADDLHLEHMDSVIMAIKENDGSVPLNDFYMKSNINGRIFEKKDIDTPHKESNRRVALNLGSVEVTVTKQNAEKILQQIKNQGIDCNTTEQEVNT